MSSYQWKPRIRNYNQEKRQSSRSEAITHPLKIRSVFGPETKTPAEANDDVNGSVSKPNHKATDSKKTKKTVENNHKKEPAFIDPLGAALDDQDLDQNSAFNDALSRLSLDNGLHNSLAGEEDQDSGLCAPPEPELVGFESWNSKRNAILQQYTTNEKLSIETSFLAGGVPLQSVISVTDRTAHRLEQFDDQRSMRRMADLSQQEYVKRINEMNAALLSAWAEDQRVESVKVVIQCAKLLSDSSVSQFYPSQFVLVTDILDTFGTLVYDRLWSKANVELKADGLPTLGRFFEPDQVPATTKETARNWFYKIASIRELLPRFYVETAIIRSLRFLVPSSEAWTTALSRLAGMVRGIADPLVAAYARCYLCRVGMVLQPSNRTFVWQCLHDWLQIYKPPTIDKRSPEHNLLWPALEWIIQCVTYGANDDDLLPLWEYCKQTEKRNLLLFPILNAFPARYLASNALEVCEIVLAGGQDSGSWLRTFGLRLLVAEPSPDVNRALLRQVWKSLMRFNSLNVYMTCAEVWIEFTCRHFGAREVNTLLDDIIRHVLPDAQYKDFYPQLLSILNKIVTNQPDFKQLFGMDRFVAFLDLFRKDSVRLQACHSLLTAFVRLPISFSNTQEDMSLCNHVMNLCKSLHDSLNTLSLEDERRVAVQLICKSIDRFKFDHDPERMLTCYVEARANFSNLDEVIEFLVRRVNRLAMETREKMRSRHTRSTANFVRACVAYTYITIPSIVEPFTRLRLYREAASVALVNNCLPQADALLKAAISLIPEIPSSVAVSANRRKTTEPQMLESLQNLLSLLLLVPDPPEQGQPLYLFKGLLNAIQKYGWSENADYKAVAYVRLLCWLSAAAQPEYPYQIEAVESNDTLYGASDHFVSVVNSTASEVLSLLLAHLKTLQSAEQFKRLASVALDLLECILHQADLSQMTKLAVQLYKLALQHGVADKSRLHSIMGFVNAKAQTDRNPGWVEFLQRIK